MSLLCDVAHGCKSHDTLRNIHPLRRECEFVLGHGQCNTFMRPLYDQNAHGISTERDNLHNSTEEIVEYCLPLATGRRDAGCAARFSSMVRHSLSITAHPVLWYAEV